MTTPPSTSPARRRGNGRGGGPRLGLRVLGSVSIAAVLTGIAALGLATGWLGGFQRRATDAVQPRGSADPGVAVVAIDAAAIDGADRGWPWPRTTSAQLVRRLHQAGARVIAVDVVFSPAADGDDDLAGALRDAGPVVVAEVPLLCATGDPSGCTPERAGVAQAVGVVGPVPEVGQAATTVGHTAVVPDSADGVVRSLPLVVEHDRRFVPALALAATALAEGADPTQLVVRPDGVQLGARTIPTDAHHRLALSYAPELVAGLPGAPVVSAAAVLDGDPQALAAVRDKVVFVGVTDPAVGDAQLTPLAERLQPGVLLHAQAFDTIATRAYLAPASTAASLALVFVVALVVALAVQLLRVVPAAVVVLATGAGVVALFLGLAQRGTLVNLVWPLVALVVAVPLSGGLRFVLVDRDRRRVTDLFGRYVPDEVAAQLVADGLGHDEVTGTRVDIATLFCDLRGFTALSATLEPAAVRAMLEHYYEYATAVVFAERGTVLQFVGDEVFAVWGAPAPADDGPAAALRCARRLQEEVDELDDRLAAVGFPPVRFGIGVHRGPVVAAHVGTDRRRQYTVLGDTVNVGARLCAQAGPGQVVLSDEVRAAVEPPPPVEGMGPLTMKGVRADFVAWKLVLDHPPSGTHDR